MLLSYLKLSFRLLARNPTFACINITGLAAGLAIFFLLWQFTQSELSSDGQWNDSDATYRFGVIGKWTDDKQNWEQSPFATILVSLSDQIVPQYPEITEVTRILSQPNFTGATKEKSYVRDHGPDLFLTVETGTEKKSFKETKLVYADPNLFTFFGLPLIEGDPESVLDLPNSIVISRKLAVKYFGTIDAIGSTILINDQITLVVTGVFDDLPQNTHLSFDAVVSSERIGPPYHTVEGEIHAPVQYMKIRKGVRSDELCKRINADMHRQIARAYFGESVLGDAEVYLQPLREMPFQTYIADDYTPKSILVLTIMQGTALAILFLAWINYINLTGAANLGRLKELATRKVIGAKGIELASQFIIEAFVVNTIALLLALTVVQLVKSPVESVLGFYILPWTSLPGSYLWILLTVFACGVILTGLFPAWVVMRHNSKSLFERTYRHGSMFTTLFTTLQYSLAIAIVVFAFAIKGQINFILMHDIGLTKEEVLVVDLPLNRSGNFKSNLNSFAGKVRELGGSVSSSVPGDPAAILIGLIQSGFGGGAGVTGNGGVDENFLPLYKIKIVEGRNFLPDNPVDSNSILISEITATRLGFESATDAIGRKIIVSIDGESIESSVVGVFGDYETLPMLNNGYHQSKGLVLTYKDFLFANGLWSNPQKVSFRIQPELFDKSIAKIKKAYHESFSDPLFNWYFLDDVINGKYRQHLLVSNQIGLFSFLAVGIACLGLLGMMLHKVNNKVKEIGIRKVLGAQLHQIAKVLLIPTVIQIVIATLIGIPIAYYLTQQYLQKFSERIVLEWWHFAFPIGILVLIMFATISSVLWKAARSSPVEALKHE